MSSSKNLAHVSAKACFPTTGRLSSRYLRPVRKIRNLRLRKSARGRRLMKQQRGGTGPSVRIGTFPAAGNDISSITVNSNRFSQESGTSEAWSIAASLAAEVTTSGNYWWNPTSDNVGGDEITDPDYSGPGGPSIP